MATTILPEQELATFRRAIHGSLQHAVDLRGTSIEHEPEFDLEIHALCGQKAYLTHRWGVFGDDNPIGGAFRRCAHCGWIAALQRGETAEELQRYAQRQGARSEEMALVVKILTAVLDAQGGGDGLTGWETHGEETRLSQLLGHIGCHAPAVFVCHGCADDDECDYSHTAQWRPGFCPGRQMACMACTALAGEWAGELEGKTLGECFVPAPCSVLVAAARHYNIPIGPKDKLYEQSVSAESIAAEIVAKWQENNDEYAEFSIDSEEELRGYLRNILGDMPVTLQQGEAEPAGAIDGSEESGDERRV
jgi:hypothetical protein